MKLFLPHFLPQEIEQLVSTLHDEFPSGQILYPVESVEAVSWTLPEGSFACLFNTLAQLVLDKYRMCVDNICTAIDQKATISKDKTNRVVNMADVKATIHSQSVEDPTSLYSELMLHVNRQMIVFEDGVNVESVETLLRRHCVSPPFSWCNLRAALQFCESSKDVSQTGASRVHPTLV